jgi:hypothetical protein
MPAGITTVNAGGPEPVLPHFFYRVT